MNEPVRGALVDQQQLIQLRFASAGLKLGRNGRHFGRQQGGHHSPFKGRGLEFQRLREYQAGDEIRHIDWRVTARTTRPHTRVFQEERERPLVLCLDQRQAMFFGSRHCFKSVLACHVGAALAWAGLDNNDRVGGLVFADDQHREVRPRRSRRSVLHWLHSAVDYNHQLANRVGDNPPPSDSLARALEELRRITKPGSTVFVISDFAGLEGEAARQLHLIARHNDVIALHIADPMEAELPGAGAQQWAVSDGRERLLLELNPALRQRFREDYNERREAAARIFRRAGIHQLALRTDQPFYSTLQRGLSR